MRIMDTYNQKPGVKNYFHKYMHKTQQINVP